MMLGSICCGVVSPVQCSGATPPRQPKSPGKRYQVAVWLIGLYTARLVMDDTYSGQLVSNRPSVLICMSFDIDTDKQIL